MSAPTPNLFGGYSNLEGPWPSPDDQAWPEETKEPRRVRRRRTQPEAEDDASA